MSHQGSTFSLFILCCVNVKSTSIIIIETSSNNNESWCVRSTDRTLNRHYHISIIVRNNLNHKKNLTQLMRLNFRIEIFCMLYYFFF